jgi:CheY-like chemotaxis protein
MDIFSAISCGGVTTAASWPFQKVPPAGFEPAPPPPEGGALSPELRGPFAPKSRYQRTSFTLAAMTSENEQSVSGIAEPVRVLVVDDDEVIRQLITLNLELEGFEVHEAADGEDALRAAVDFDPSVITLDIMMPNLDGWDAAARLRANPKTAHIKVVLLSARAQEADVRRGARIGVDAYLTKPFDPDDLVDIVRRLAGVTA